MEAILLVVVSPVRSYDMDGSDYIACFYVLMYVDCRFDFEGEETVFLFALALI